jgi:hypothetical protein
MTYEQIEEALKKQRSANSVFEIKFRTRNAIKGMFIETTDYRELSRKNFWRIVSESHIDEYTKSQDETLARIFNGSEFTKLQVTS